MIPAGIRYHAAVSVQEAEELLRTFPGEARLLAGGTDLMGVLKEGVHAEQASVLLVDLKTVPGLDAIVEREGELVIGALARVADVARSGLVRDRLPMLADAASLVASPQLREMGTVGGNLCQEPRCWYYRYPEDAFHCHRKGGDLCAAAVGDNRYHSIFGAAKVVDPPCVTACPNHTHIPGYFEALRRMDLSAAARSLLTENPIPAITGRICPHLCETGCNRAGLDESLSIRGLEREVGDYILSDPSAFLEVAPPTGKSVAVVGSGPAGLTAAFYLRREGHSVTILERESRAGGMLALGIPPFRLAPDVVSRVYELFADLGVAFRFGVDVGREVSLRDLEASFDAVVVACGAWLGALIGIEGEEASTPGLDYLRDAALDETWREHGTVVVIGGGNVAVDCAMTALERGASSVVMACLESRSEMPAFDWEIDDALAAGVQLKVRWGPRTVRLEDGRPVGVDLVHCTSVFDEEGAFCPTLDESVRDFVAADKVVMAVGQRVDAGWYRDRLDESGSPASVVVCGDAESGPATVVEAIASGREAATSIHILLTGEPLPALTGAAALQELVSVDADSPERATRELDPGQQQGSADSRARGKLHLPERCCRRGEPVSELQLHRRVPLGSRASAHGLGGGCRDESAHSLGI